MNKEREQWIELIDRMLGWCDERALSVIYRFVLHLVKDM